MLVSPFFTCLDRLVVVPKIQGYIFSINDDGGTKKIRVKTTKKEEKSIIASHTW